MAHIRKLPSGKYHGEVRLHAGPGGRVHFTHPLKSAVKAWADDLESDVRHGRAIDPRGGKTTVGEVWETARKSRRLELASRKRDESQWRNHVEPRWGSVPVGPITRPDVRAWANEMEKAGAGPWTIQGCLNVLRAVLNVAIDMKLIRDNPVIGVSGPTPGAKAFRVLEPEEDELLLGALDRVAGGRPEGRLLGELMLYCGLRWEEGPAIDREHVRVKQQLLDIGPVVERDGTIRPYAKNGSPSELVPVPNHLWPQVRELVMATSRGGLLITSAAGKILNYSNWYHRVWEPALDGLPELVARRGRAHRPAVAGAGLADPQPTPHDLRHTYGTRLAEQGVPLHEIMALMRQRDVRSCQRYLHASEQRFSRARKAVAKARRHNGRTADVRHELSTSVDTDGQPLEGPRRSGA